ncbi:flagellar basal-body rod protein FlgF [Desulfogranum mediterraneum]|uniref:flagellar basal-body rod protein FlgF n=1 Tax=Desulfogranum mediterraneum TaxID=160661 RepID=UPI0003FE45C0|nr:flagellar basal-body rod protein FlgF [Desulfogranum mediterraneum]
MVSGKYSALSGAVAREQALDNIAANLANVNSSGFKKNKVSFEAILRGTRQVGEAGGLNYSRIRTIGTNFDQGGLQETGRDLDLAINGEGFFKIQAGAETLYSRAGHFKLDENGMIKTPEGYQLLGAGNQPLQLLEAQGKQISIDDNGLVSIDGVDAGVRFQVFTVADQSQLKPAGQSRFRLAPEAASQAKEEFRLVQGSLETSNVNMMEEMALMINTQRKFEAHLKALENYSRLSDKQDELGSLG